MITAAEKPGMQTYERSVVFLMLKAFYDVAGRENIQRISVEYSISHALFIQARGNFVLNQELLGRVEDRMKELVELAVPLQKTSVHTDDAVELFRQAQLTDKARCSASGSIPMSTSIPWMASPTIFTGTWSPTPAI